MQPLLNDLKQQLRNMGERKEQIRKQRDIATAAFQAQEEEISIQYDTLEKTIAKYTGQSVRGE